MTSPAAHTTSSARIGVDVGGTFTDVVLQGADGTVQISKVLSTPPAYDRAVVDAVSGLAHDPAAVRGVVHGTTVATNAVLERRGAATALVTTAGFRDVLELRASADPAHVRPVLAQARPARAAPPALRAARAHHRRRRRARAGLRRRGACARGAAPRGRGSSPSRSACSTPTASPSTKRRPAGSSGRSSPGSRSPSRARSCASSASTSGPRRRSSTPMCAR